MTAFAAPRPAPDAARPVSREPAWWGMLLFVASEGALFLFLLAAYFYLRVHSGGHWPQGDIEAPRLWRPSVMTALLAASSVPAYLSEHAARRGLQLRLRLSLAAVLALGGAFLGLEVWDYSVTLDKFQPRENAYASIYYTVTGIHGAHVAVGLILAAWTLTLALRGRFTPERNLAVQNVALYWYFANLSWLALFASLYLSVSL